MLGKKNQETDSLILYVNFALTFYKVIPNLQNYIAKKQLEDLYPFGIYCLKLQGDTHFEVLN